MTDVGVGSKYAATKFGEVLQQINLGLTDENKTKMLL